MAKIKVTIWNEGRHEKRNPKVQEIYPDGIHNCVKRFLEVNDDMEVRAVTLDDPDNGLPDELLNDTDVLMWWGHMAHNDVPDALAAKVRDRVWNEGMGFIAMHSAHMSKPFRNIVGTSGQLSWGDDQRELMWNILPQHPIAAGIPEYFEIEQEEMYGEPFRVPQPDELIFVGWYEGGNIFRSGMTYYRGIGKLFYFQPGHELCRSFHNPYVQKVLTNAVRWAAPTDMVIKRPTTCPHRKNPLVELAEAKAAAEAKAE
ncbi:MAG: ThuA domain-containing protein [Clostridia bacterium]|nr:ThuA domain-containing protein [Clostridia bacterium]